MEEYKSTPKTIPLSQISKDPVLWERAITDEDVDDLANNIEDVGLQIHRILVRPLSKNHFGLLAGMRRFLALKKLGRREAKCEIVKVKDDDDAAAISLSENLKIKRPDTREWKAGVKLLCDIHAKKYKAREEKEKQRNARLRGSKAVSELTGPGPVNSNVNKTPKRGRPSKGVTEIDKSVGKMVGASADTIYRTRKLYDGLNTTAKKAYESGNLTTKQAEKLSRMSKAQQYQQLPLMLRETQETTTRRLQEERDANVVDAEAKSTIANIRLLMKKAEQLQEASEFFVESVRHKALDWTSILEKTKPSFTECAAALQRLQDFLDS